jgi:hypothetical protein
MQDEEVGKNVDHIDRLELASDTDRQVSRRNSSSRHPMLASITRMSRNSIGQLVPG